MRNKAILLTVLVCLFSTNLIAQQSRRKARRSTASHVSTTNRAQILPIRRVILYSNGVAYVERRGVVSGNAEVDLSFKQSQVDDVLKSMIVLDLGKGRIGAISYNSSAPPSARMAEIPFSVNAKTDGNSSGGIAGVLSQLQGAKVLVSSSKGTATGAILTVEKRMVKNDKISIPTHFLVITSEQGEILNFNLADVRSVKLLDTDTKRDVKEFANASAASRRRDAKTISITSEGVGKRELVVSYTIAAPIWKTTYRVILNDEGKPFFQGWAIVDNVSEDDWKNVKLSLVSGSPVSFIQNIQKPFYRYRPVVPIPRNLQLSPQTYETGDSNTVNGRTSTKTRKSVTTTDATIGNNFNPKQIVQLPRNLRQANDLLALQPGVTRRGYGVGRGSGNGTNNIVLDGVDINDQIINQNSGIQTSASGDELGDLFEYRINQPITVMRNRSALIPIIQTKMEGERVSIYNEAFKRNRPLGGMLLKNSTTLTFESGSLTVIDRNAYAGEALMKRLKPKERRLISYSLDLGVHIKVRNKFNRNPAKLVKVVNGVFQIHYFRTNKKVYEIANQTDRKKIVYLEYPIKSGWKLSDKTPEPDYSTQNFHRFRIELKPHEHIEFPISENQPLRESYRLSTISRSNLELFVKRRYIDDETRAKLEKLITLRSQIAQIDAKLSAFLIEERTISKDQARLRENIKALSKTVEAKQLITRYVQKADKQETRIEQITSERKKLAVEKHQLRNAFAKAIRDFQFEQKSTDED